MTRQIVFLFLFISIFSLAALFAEPDPDTIIGLTASFGESSGRVEARYEILQHSEFLKTMFSADMMEVDQIKNGQDICLDLTLGPIYQKLEDLGVEGFFMPQNLLNEIVVTLIRVHQQEDLDLNHFCLGIVLQLLFVGDALQIPELVEAEVCVLALDIVNVDPKILFGLMQCDAYGFSTCLAQKIVAKNSDLFSPVEVKKAADTLIGHSDRVRSGQFNFDGTKIVTASDDKTAKVWGVDKNGHWRCVATLRGHSSRVNSGRFNFDGTKIVTASDDYTAKVWGVEKHGAWKCVATLKGHTCWVNSVVFSEDGKQTVTTSNDRTAKVWKVDDKGFWGCEATLDGYSDIVVFAQFSFDGGMIVVASYSDKSVKVWGVDENGCWKCVAKLEGHTSRVMSARFNFDATKIVTASNDYTAKVWGVDENGCWNCEETLEGHTRCVCSAQFNFDGTKIVTWSDDVTVRVWEQSENGIWNCNVLKGYGGGLLLSPQFNFDGTKIVTCSLEDYTANVWGMDDNGHWRREAMLEGHTAAVKAQFNHDCTKIITASWDETARIWDVSFLNKPFLLRQVLFVVLAKQRLGSFLNLSRDWLNFFSKIWMSFALPMRKHLKNEYSEIDFERLRIWIL